MLPISDILIRSISGYVFIVPVFILYFLVYYLLSKVLPNNLRKQFQSENVNDMVEVPLFAIYTFIIMVTVQPWVIHSLLNIG